ncbi:hypothetical protein [Endozoicomonas sp. 2B-B]
MFSLDTFREALFWLFKVSSAAGNEAFLSLMSTLRGMNKVAHFKKVGFKFNQWQDVGYWQIIMQT